MVHEDLGLRGSLHSWCLWEHLAFTSTPLLESSALEHDPGVLFLCHLFFRKHHPVLFMGWGITLCGKPHGSRDESRFLNAKIESQSFELLSF